MSEGTDGAEPWEDPPRMAAPGSSPVLLVEGFEGPLDFLLEMARKQRIDLRRFSVLAVVEALGRALEAALADGSSADLTRWGEWLGMAAQLALLRSRLLLPPDAPEARAAQAEADALRRQLLDREGLRRAGAWLEARPQVGRDVFLRPLRTEACAGPRGSDVTALFMACLVALRVPYLAETYVPQRPPLWLVSDAMAQITRRLAEHPEGERLEAFVPAKMLEGRERELQCRAAVASTLVAGLELCRGGALTMWEGDDGIWIGRPFAAGPTVG